MEATPEFFPSPSLKIYKAGTPQNFPFGPSQGQDKSGFSRGGVFLIALSACLVRGKRAYPRGDKPARSSFDQGQTPCGELPDTQAAWT